MSAETSTTVVPPPTFISTLRFNVAPTVTSTFSRTVSEKPLAVVVTRYRPSGSSGALKKPSELLETVRSNPVSVFFTTTLAPFTTAPFGSTTVP